MNPGKIKKAAEIHNVCEMTLLSTADLTVWRDYLSAYSLVPADYNGRSVVLMICSEMEYMKKSFREFSVSVLVEAIKHHSGSEGAFLLYALKTNRLFAWSERVFFSTPYYFGRISFDSARLSRADIFYGNDHLFTICNSISSSRLPEFENEDKWKGPIYLPFRNGQNQSRNKWFYSKLSGYTRKYSFSAAEDSVILNNSSSNEAIQLMVKSGLKGHQWIIRKRAVHFKSRTYSF